MKTPRILIVDDEPAICRLCAEILERRLKCQVVTDTESPRAAERLKTETFDLMLTDISMPTLDGIELLRIARAADPELPVLILTGHPTVDTAVEAMKLGAADYLAKPFLADDLVANVQRILEQRRLTDENRVLTRQVERPYVFDEIVGTSPAMQKVFKLVQQVADSNVDVLIIGETGTGKELIARAIHSRSRRAKERFVPVNSGAIPENLLESELFGHERGSFTGAEARSVGLMEFADKGTFFLDEIGELPLPMQAKLLRALQERKVRRVGGKDEISLDVRFVAATGVDLADAVKQRRFREDLYYRINVLEIHLPPLRDRSSDIPDLIQHFLSRVTREAGKEVTGVSPEVREVLLHYRWPGNIRELQNAIRRAVTVAQAAVLAVEDLPDAVVTGAGSPQPKSTGGFFDQREDRLNAFERDYLSGLLSEHGGDVAAAAIEAKIPRGTYYRLMKKYGLNAPDFRRDR